MPKPTPDRASAREIPGCTEPLTSPVQGTSQFRCALARFGSFIAFCRMTFARYRPGECLRELTGLRFLFKLHSGQYPRPGNHIFGALRLIMPVIKPYAHYLHDVGQRDPTIPNSDPEHPSSPPFNITPSCWALCRKRAIRSDRPNLGD